MQKHPGIGRLGLTLCLSLWLLAASAAPLRVNYPQAQVTLDRAYFV